VGRGDSSPDEQRDLGAGQRHRVSSEKNGGFRMTTVATSLYPNEIESVVIS
jgi:hypothetical protein